MFLKKKAGVIKDTVIICGESSDFEGLLAGRVRLGSRNSIVVVSDKRMKSLQDIMTKKFINQKKSKK